MANDGLAFGRTTIFALVHITDEKAYCLFYKKCFGGGLFLSIKQAFANNTPQNELALGRQISEDFEMEAMDLGMLHIICMHAWEGFCVL